MEITTVPSSRRQRSALSADAEKTQLLDSSRTLLLPGRMIVEYDQLTEEALISKVRSLRDYSQQGSPYPKKIIPMGKGAKSNKNFLTVVFGSLPDDIRGKRIERSMALEVSESAANVHGFSPLCISCLTMIGCCCISYIKKDISDELLKAEIERIAHVYNNHVCTEIAGNPFNQPTMPIEDVLREITSKYVALGADVEKLSRESIKKIVTYFVKEDFASRTL